MGDVLQPPESYATDFSRIKDFIHDLSEKDCGRATVEPKRFVAGSRATLKVTYVAGRAGILRGGAIRIKLPWFGMDPWEPGKVTAAVSRSDVAAEVQVEDACPSSHHWRRHPAVTVRFWGGDLTEGDEVFVVFGEVGGYFSGFRHLSKVRELAGKGLPIQIFVDVFGSGCATREMAIPQAWRPIASFPTVDVAAGRPERFVVTIRDVPAEGRKPIVVVAAVDRYFNRAENYAGAVRLQEIPSGTEVGGRIAFRRKKDAGSRCVEVKVGDGPVQIAAVDLENGLIGKSNLQESGFAEPYNIYFGDMHVMTGYYSPNACGTTEDAYLYARDVMGLDFGVVTNSGRMQEVDQELAERYNEPHVFATILAYECGFKDGHKNVYFRNGGESCPPFKDHASFWKALSGKQVLVAPHTPNLTSESYPGFWGPGDFSKRSQHKPRYERLIEICQNRGASETDVPEWPTLFAGYGASVRDVLNRGYRFGFIGGSDNHCSRPGHWSSSLVGLDPQVTRVTGLTAVLAEELTREALWDALHARRCYATTGIRARLVFACDGRPMGSIFRVGRKDPLSGRRVFRIKVLAESEIAAIDLVRNGEVLLTETPDARRVELEMEDGARLDRIATIPCVKTGSAYYYLRVRFANRQVAWSSPIWFDAKKA